ncbi:MAG: hypothetical protein GY699_11355 [Desulfobacteraceae bacterium]|nr:hypothetical protein [Desulfobacteraceae bacterium]
MNKANFLKRFLAIFFLTVFSASTGFAYVVDPMATIVGFNTAQTGTITDLNLWVELGDDAIDPPNDCPPGTICPQNVDILLRHNGVDVHVFDATDDVSEAFNVVFDDEASSLLYVPKNAEAVGTFLPDNPLMAFDDMELFGLWELVLWDNIVPNDGTDLLVWAISGTVVDSQGIATQFDYIYGPTESNIDNGNSVPIPSAILLLASGILGLAGVSRRKK